ncbi:hypothetical protein [Phenylobacterium sp.]|uniref:hypothetical protein n=1 Tax=Phenylobacterium sp. TaxID=1871053 RepID=UPI0025EAC52A|nr:hypothetical protein [Phenylobacterium sp.]MBX3481899.1 hypothetical protein [Phenylobacterium sp.]MCW5758748.1 hypothetical protein [Phenylobacterium sp.]
MKLPEPRPGLVIRYSFLWSHEAAAGADEAAKDRPCAIVVAAAVGPQGGVVTIVAPITHAEPPEDAASQLLPAEAARALGLDDERHWIRLDELNRFLWPGYDLRPIPGADTCAYGMLPRPLFETVKQRIQTLARARRARTRDRG